MSNLGSNNQPVDFVLLAVAEQLYTHPCVSVCLPDVCLSPILFVPEYALSSATQYFWLFCLIKAISYFVKVMPITIFTSLVSNQFTGFPGLGPNLKKSIKSEPIFFLKWVWWIYDLVKKSFRTILNI